MGGQFFHSIPGFPFSLDVALHNHPARFAIRRKLAKIKPDLVHAWGTERIYPAALQDCKVPTILSMQGGLTEYDKIGGLGDSWIWRRMVSSEPAMIRSSTVVTSESQWGIDRVLEVHQPPFPALRSGLGRRSAAKTPPLALSGASRRKQFPCNTPTDFAEEAFHSSASTGGDVLWQPARSSSISSEKPPP